MRRRTVKMRFYVIKLPRLIGRILRGLLSRG
ncbi:MAG: stage V sporulation protein M [Dethiobacteria bacterium]